MLRSLAETADALTIVDTSVNTVVAGAASALGKRPTNSLWADAVVTVALPVAAAVRSLTACWSFEGSIPYQACPSAAPSVSNLVQGVPSRLST